MTHNEVTKNLKVLEDILSNFRKAPKRRFLKSTLIKRKRTAQLAYDNLVYFLDDYEHHEQKKTILVARELYGRIQTLINSRLESARKLVKFSALCQSLIAFNKLLKKIKMPNPKLDLGLALKLVAKFEGESLQLGNFLETVDLLKEYSEGVSDGEMIKFLKTRLVGPAHGTIESAATLTEAKKAIIDKFAVKLTPTACEAELKLASQKKLTITEFGKEVEQLAARLASAHVSTKTFPNEAAADAIVQPAAISAFIGGLNNQNTAFFVKARNPMTLNKAISDALEVLPEKREEAHWYQAGPSWISGRGRGRGGNFSRGFRGRYSSQNRNNGQNYGNNNNNNNNNHNGNYQQRGTNRGRGGRGHFRGNNNHSNNNNNGNNNNRQGRNTGHSCNCVQGEQQRPNNARPQNQQQNEEVNTMEELFRE